MPLRQTDMMDTFIQSKRLGEPDWEDLEHGKIETVHNRFVGEVDLPERALSRFMSPFLV